MVFAAAYAGARRPRLNRRMLGRSLRSPSPDGVAEYTDKRRRILLRTNSDIVFNSINIISSPHEKLLSILGWEGDDTVLWNYHISNYDWF